METDYTHFNMPAAFLIYVTRYERMRERMMTLGGLDPFTRLCSAWTRQRGSLNHVSAELDSRTHEMDEKWMDFSLTPQSHTTPQHAGVRGGRGEGIRTFRYDKFVTGRFVTCGSLRRFFVTWNIRYINIRYGTSFVTQCIRYKKFRCTHGFLFLG